MGVEMCRERQGRSQTEVDHLFHICDRRVSGCKLPCQNATPIQKQKTEQILPLAMKATSSLARELIKLRSPGICRGCEIRTSLRIIRHLRKPSVFRHASTVSVTAVNAERDVPRAFKELHQALDRLKKDALSYVNISKLQLALRGLESTSPVTRIAVLGLNNQKAARSLARLLCADALSDQGEWERRLEEFDADDTRAIILR